MGFTASHSPHPKIQARAFLVEERRWAKAWRDKGIEGAPPGRQTLRWALHPRTLHARAVLGYLSGMPVSICQTSTVYQVLEERTELDPMPAHLTTIARL